MFSVVMFMLVVMIYLVMIDLGVYYMVMCIGWGMVNVMYFIIMYWKFIGDEGMGYNMMVGMYKKCFFYMFLISVMNFKYLLGVMFKVYEMFFYLCIVLIVEVWEISVLFLVLMWNS